MVTCYHFGLLVARCGHTLFVLTPFDRFSILLFIYFHKSAFRPCVLCFGKKLLTIPIYRSDKVMSSRWPFVYVLAGPSEQ